MSEFEDLYNLYYKDVFYYVLKLTDYQVHMSTENSVKRSLKTRSLLTKIGTCSIATTGAVTFS